MTRKQVAQRLGKSLATVRRIEGVLLHPTLDSQGKYHFDPDEVEALARSVQSGEVALWQQMRGESQPLEGTAMSDFERVNECATCRDREEEVQRLKDELDEQQRRYRHELARLRSEREQEQAKYKSEQRELERELRKFIAVVEDM